MLPGSHLGNFCEEREFLIDSLLVRIHFIIVMIKWTGLSQWEFEFPFPSSLTSTFLEFCESPYPPPVRVCIASPFRRFSRVFPRRGEVSAYPGSNQTLEGVKRAHGFVERIRVSCGGTVAEMCGGRIGGG